MSMAKVMERRNRLAVIVLSSRVLRGWTTLLFLDEAPRFSGRFGAWLFAVDGARGRT